MRSRINLRRNLAAGLAGWLLWAVSAAQAGMYQYTDETGVLHYVDSESKIPARYRREATQRLPKDNAIHRDTGPAVPQQPPPAGAIGTVRIPDVKPGEASVAAESAGTRSNSPEFWKRRKHLLEEKVQNLKNDCDFWQASARPPAEAPVAAAARERGLKQCERLVKARQDLDSLASEVRKQGGSPAWLSD